jgi:hypothetical protein
MTRTSLTIGNLTALITVHFWERWAERIGSPFNPPILKIVEELKRRNDGHYLVPWPRGEDTIYILVEARGLEIRFVTVAIGEWLGRQTPLLRLEAA